MQIVRELSPDLRQEGRYLRKAAEWGSANTISRIFGNDRRALALAYLNIVSFAISHGDVRGISAFSDIVFGKSDTSKLSRAECAIAAVAVNRPLILADTPVAIQRWSDRKGRAIQLLAARYGNEASADISEIRAMGDRPPYRSLIAGFPESVAHSLGARTRAIISPNLGLITADLEPPPLSRIAGNPK